MQPEKFINKTIEISKNYLEKDRLNYPKLFTLNLKGKITNISLTKYTKDTNLKQYIKSHNIIAYALTKKIENEDLNNLSPLISYTNKNSLQISFVSSYEKKIITLPYISETGKITFEDFKENKIDKSKEAILCLIN